MSDRFGSKGGLQARYQAFDLHQVNHFEIAVLRIGIAQRLIACRRTWPLPILETSQSPLRAGHYHIDLSAASGTDQPLAPIGDGRFGAY